MCLKKDYEGIWPCLRKGVAVYIVLSAMYKGSADAALGNTTIR